MAPVTPDPPTRSHDRYKAIVEEQAGLCLKCDTPVAPRPLPGSAGTLCAPLCDRHLRWAMAARRERIGKQAGQLKRLLAAWFRTQGIDRQAVRDWLGY